jgi:alkylation response protein AidB-like acyl-CoA dehydrogenase
VAFPAGAVTVGSTWEVSGLRATASHDFAVVDAFVPAAYSFAVGDVPSGSGPLYRFPFGAIAELSFAAVALGIAHHALDEFAALASTWRLAESGALLRARPAAHEAYARAEASVSAARSWLFELAGTAWNTVEGGRHVSAGGQREMRLAALHATAAAATATQSLYDVAGIAPLFMSSDLGRCVRDLHALTQNAAVSPARLGEVGRELLTSPARRARAAER